jgi:hypothetical protein
VQRAVKAQTDKMLLLVRSIFFRKITAMDKKKLAIRGKKE